MGKIIGIDLGTTNSVVAVLEDREPVVITSPEGDRLTPSVVAFNQHGERLIGRAARRQAATNPENTIYSIKRFIGRRFDDAAVTAERRYLPYKLAPDPSGAVQVQIPQTGHCYNAQEISAAILSKLKKDVEAFLGEPVTQAVITVPAYFNDSQRQATRDAGRIAGLDVLRIINEPTAAALAYGLDRQQEETVLVFDLGGGTFDVSILETGGGFIEVLATSGDTHLGGDDWDEAIVDWIISEYLHDQGIDLSKNRCAVQRIREAAEKAKIDLSTMAQTAINLPFITTGLDGPRHLQMTLTRARFEQLTAHLAQCLVTPIQQALQDAGLEARDLDTVLLVGGASRMPGVQQLVRQLTGKTPNQSINPDEVVALGAALQAGVLAGDVNDVLLLDVTPLTLGVETFGGVMTPLIPRNTTIPTRRSEIYSMAEDNQTAVDIHVLQGERPLAADNISLGAFRLQGIAPAPRGIPQIEVIFDIDANGILSVTARDQATGQSQAVNITAATHLNESEIERLVREAEVHATEDQKQRELIEARMVADHLLCQVEKVLENLNAHTPVAACRQVKRLIARLEVASQGEDTTLIQALAAELQQAVVALGQATY